MEKVRAKPGPRRLAVVGTSGSGKTTLAQKLGQRLGIPHVELDALYWDPNWTPTPDAAFRERTKQALSREAWTADGNYSTVRDIVWNCADTIVWLDYSLPVIMGRVIWRTIRRFVTREELWNGNRERARTSFFSRESIILWALQTYRLRRREYPALFANPAYGHLRIVHLRSPRETREWFKGLGATNGAPSVPPSHAPGSDRKSR